MADSMTNSSSPLMERKLEDDTRGEPGPSARPINHQQHEMAPYPYHHSTTNSGAYMFADNVPPRFYPEPEHTNGAYTHARMERNTQMQFMDFTINNINDWNWGDLGNLIGPDAVPNMHPQMHPPPGPPPGPT
jgi:hypothetical protein